MNFSNVQNFTINSSVYVQDTVKGAAPGEPQPLQDGSRDTFAVTDEPEQDVLGPNEIMTEPPCLFPGQDDDPTRPLRESLEHCG